MNKPNIIYILADDMGYGDVSYLNEKAGFTTPCLDDMCRNGMAFSDAHASSAVCTPSRYSILTGRYNWRSRLKEGVLFGFDEPLIEEGRETVAGYLQQQGYKTACIGKWHLGLGWEKLNKDEKDGKAIDFNNVLMNDTYDDGIDYSKPLWNTPIHQGFDYFFGIPASLDMAPYVYIENDRVTSMPDHIATCDREGIYPPHNKGFFRDGPAGADFVHEEVLPNFTQKVIDKIEEYKEEPFFIYFPLNAPHTPILPTKKFQGASGTNAYGDFVLMCDDIVGQIRDKLRQVGIEENTLIIFTSDNGCSPMANYGELAQYGHNPSYIFRGHKADIYEGGHRVPYIMEWPAVIKGDSTCDEVVCLMDLFGTVKEIISPDATTVEDSISHLSLMKGSKEATRDSLVHHSIKGEFSIRKGPWKLELCPGSGGWSEPRPEHSKGLPLVQLYNLEKDIRERQNVYKDYPQVVEELTKELNTIKDM